MTGHDAPMTNFHTRTDLLASGTTVDELRHALRSGQLRRVARGVYMDGGADADPLALHRARLHTYRDPAGAFSHVSAAVLHGFTLWRVDLSRVHISRSGNSGGSRTSSLHIHSTSLRPDEIRHVDGLPVTSPLRTVVDLARTLPADQAVVAGDSALTIHPDITSSLSDALASARSRSGIAAARRTLPFLDGRSESPGESLSRVRIRAAGLPAPVLQHELRTPSGAFVARPDFFWKDAGVVGEFDGRGKYGCDEPGTTAEIVHREKRREDAIRSLGFEVVRWTWEDLFRFEPVREALTDAARRARARQTRTPRTDTR